MHIGPTHEKIESTRVQTVVEHLVRTFNPASIFVYGSRSRGDAIDGSDYEMCIVFHEDNYVSRREVQAEVSDSEIHIYPAYYNQILDGTYDTPFQRSLFFRELSMSAITITGEPLVEELTPPPIHLIDIIQDVRFRMGSALTAVVSNRNGDSITAADSFNKSCLFATRAYSLFIDGTFPLTYEDIASRAPELNLGQQYQELVQRAYQVRRGESFYSEDLFVNITYLNQFIEPQLMERFHKEGNVLLME